MGFFSNFQESGIDNGLLSIVLAPFFLHTDLAKRIFVIFTTIIKTKTSIALENMHSLSTFKHKTEHRYEYIMFINYSTVDKSLGRILGDLQ